MKERSKVSRTDVPAATHRKTHRARVAKLVLLSILALATLGAVTTVAVKASQPRVRQAAQQARDEARRLGAERDRNQIASDGTLLLGDPRSAGGPTWGTGRWADLEVVNGTDIFMFGPDGHPEDPRTKAYILMHVKNKSDYIWNDVAVDIAMYDAMGTFLRIETHKIGTIQPGQTRRKTCGPLNKEEQGSYRLLGFRGVKATPPPDAD